MSDDPVIYIHYGDNELLTPGPIRNRPHFTKPYGGLWASRIDDPCGWRRWCESEAFRLESFQDYFMFTLKEGARVLELNDPEQLLKLPQFDPPYKPGEQWSECHLDFKKLSEEYDAVEVTDISRLYWPLYGWDCNSILIMNPEVVNLINVVKEETV